MTSILIPTAAARALTRLDDVGRAIILMVYAHEYGLIPDAPAIPERLADIADILVEELRTVRAKADERKAYKAARAKEARERARVDTRGQTETRVDKSGQEWTRVDTRGQNPTQPVAKSESGHAWTTVDTRRHAWTNEEVPPLLSSPAPTPTPHLSYSSVVVPPRADAREDAPPTGTTTIFSEEDYLAKARSEGAAPDEQERFAAINVARGGTMVPDEAWTRFVAKRRPDEAAAATRRKAETAKKAEKENAEDAARRFARPIVERWIHEHPDGDEDAFAEEIVYPMDLKTTDPKLYALYDIYRAATA